MRHGARVVVLLVTLVALLGCAAPPADPWTGRWSGTNVEVDTPCGGATPAATTTPETIEIQRGHGGLFIAGHCPIYITEQSDTYATLDMGACDSALPDGSIGHFSIISGTVQLDGDEITWRSAVHVESTTRCVDASATMRGTRE